ncbi:GNAT family N-acetyltransferase [Wenjunlia tyrosinilytica]|uniref:N-acetyltransferase domain-containing protein n=1 Tax=Wenjunlia tyrosinilytica TaxID=1544741 RepID=A0A917ZZ14_9ACTN|nr:GNAT family N-acetyltransferase [Wenjunlia tyrosinilytica]GGO98177.1 hypothetical protein GCM10012280_61700 [Wenjunlia tyrosinilytica]
MSEGVRLRPFTGADAAAVLALVNADRLPGQPLADAAGLSDALRGRSRMDAALWRQLRRPVTAVAVDGAGAVVGVVSYAVRPVDGTGVILWLHCRERSAVAGALVAHAVAALGGCGRLEAFQFATPLGVGLEGLAVGHRPVTRAVLEGAGFVGEDLWRYMRAGLPVAGLARAEGVRVKRAGRGSWRLTVREGRAVVAEASVDVVGGIGVVRWLGVEPAARGRGLGRGVLGSALGLLAERGAGEVILYVDDDAPPGDERDRTAAKRLYESVGFVEVDRLHSYTREGAGV